MDHIPLAPILAWPARAVDIVTVVAAIVFLAARERRAPVARTAESIIGIGFILLVLIGALAAFL